MHSAKLLSLLALAGASVAAPAPFKRWRNHKNKPSNVVWETVVHTVYVTEIAGAPTGAPNGGAPYPPPVTSHVPVVTSAPAPVPSSTVIVIPVSSETPPPPPPPVTSEAPPPPPPAPTTEAPPPPPPAPTSEAPPPPASSAPPAPPADTGYMAIVNEWRAKLGKEPFTQSSKREATALKTAQDGHGQMVHQLLPGTFGQVLAPGQPDEFYHVYVGGWLCETPNLPGMDGVCATASQGWYYTSTGHSDILNGGYKTIGCANAEGIWACDLGSE